MTRTSTYPKTGASPHHQPGAVKRPATYSPKAFRPATKPSCHRTTPTIASPCQASRQTGL
eukprot:1015714-Prorocentrum_lima.AAC.1